MWNLNGKKILMSGLSCKSAGSMCLAFFNWLTQIASSRCSLQRASNGFNTYCYKTIINEDSKNKIWITYTTVRVSSQPYFIILYHNDMKNQWKPENIVKKESFTYNFKRYYIAATNSTSIPSWSHSYKILIPICFHKRWIGCIFPSFFLVRVLSQELTS